LILYYIRDFRIRYLANYQNHFINLLFSVIEHAQVERI